VRPVRPIGAQQWFIADSARFVARRLPVNGRLPRMRSINANEPANRLNPKHPIAASNR